MYQVLYRKWRPQTFADVSGQPQVTVTLKNELMAGRIAHAYLFTGSRGTGKTTCAKILAKAVNCLHPAGGDPCGECEICRGIDNGSVMDIVEIDAASNNGVENIRSLREEANFTPAMTRYRVYIIDEVHMLSVGAFNALLKTLEEPPAHVVFILATTEVHKLPATILSRCQRFDFRRIPPQDIADRLTYVAEQEQATLDSQAALLLARLADGGLRDALSLLDQCIGVDKTVTIEVVDQVVGIAGRDPLFRLADAVREQNSAQALEIIDELYSNSKDMMRLCEELCAHFRSLMLVKTMRDAQPLLVMTDEEYERLKKQALPTELPLILHGMDALQRTLEKMGRGANQRMEMEMALLRLCTPELDTNIDALLRRISVLERGVSAPRVAAAEDAAAFKTPELPAKEAPKMEPPKRVSIPPVKSAPAKPPAAEIIDLPEPPPPLPPEEAPSLEDLPTIPAPREESPVSPVKEEVSPTPPIEKPKAPPPALDELYEKAIPFTDWPEVLQILKDYSKPVSAAFRGSLAYLSGNYMLIDAQNSMAFELLRKEEQRKKMRDTIRQVTGRDYKLGPYKKPAEQAEQDPLHVLAKQAQDAGIPVIKK